MTGSYKKQFLLKKYFIGSMECATMGKCKNQEMRKTNEIKLRMDEENHCGVDRCAALLCVVALVLVCVGIYIVNYGKEKA